MKNNEPSWQLKFRRVPHLDNLELLHASNITHDYPRHVHEEYSFVIMLRGVETHTCRGQSYQAFPGDLMLLNADEAHSSTSVGTEYKVLHIHPKVLKELGLEVSGGKFDAPYFSNPVIKDPLLFQLLMNFHLKVEQNASALELDSELIWAIGSLLARQNKIHCTVQPHGNDAHRMKRVLDYLKSNYAENISLAQLALLADLSPFYLVRVFCQQIGLPPHEYQTQLRITNARKLICKGHSISEAALQTGFFDQSHFSRNFKRIVGIPPGRYLSHNKIVQDRTESV
jgi:AraC-like DNA-binding protein